jgi:nucleoside recognition membrane protein YjiH
MRVPTKKQPRKISRFLVSAIVGLAFFTLPVPIGERFTVPFDLVIQWILGSAPRLVAVYCLLLICVGAGGSLAALKRPRVPWESYRTSRPILAVRLVAVPLAFVYFFRAGPKALLQDGVADLMWNTLAFSVGVIVPVGATLLVLMVRYGLLEFIGTLMRPVMQPLFRLPGRSALDSLTSWIGSYSVGLYLTRKLVEEGYYTRREAFTIVTCFSTVSIGFVAVVAQTLGILRLFPLIFSVYFFAVYLLAALLARTWPVTKVPDEYLKISRPEPSHSGNARELLRLAWDRALGQAGEAAGIPRVLGKGFLDGFVLASTILGSVLVVGTLALLLAKETPVFNFLGQPLEPLLAALGLPDVEVLAPATLVGITEMYIPALLVQQAELPARFFIAVLSISQLIFFSAVGPMMIDLFRDIPVRARELVVLFLIRTAILIPSLAAVTAIVDWLGFL